MSKNHKSRKKKGKKETDDGFSGHRGAERGVQMEDVQGTCGKSMPACPEGASDSGGRPVPRFSNTCRQDLTV